MTSRIRASVSECHVLSRSYRNEKYHRPESALFLFLPSGKIVEIATIMASSSLRSFEYLESLPGLTLNKLYAQPSTVLAVFRRMLTHMCRRRPSHLAETPADDRSEEFCDGIALYQPSFTGLGS